MKVVGNVNENTIESNTIEENLEGLTVRFYGKRNKLIIGTNVKFPKLEVSFHRNDSVLVFEDNVVFMGNLYFKGDQTYMKVGSGTKSNSHIFANLGEDKDEIHIGKNCLLAQVKFRTSDSHKIFDLDTKQRINESANIRVEDKVWIAEDVLLKGGAHIRSGSVVGAKSLVTKELKSNSVYAGAPARLLKENICWKE